MSNTIDEKLQEIRNKIYQILINSLVGLEITLYRLNNRNRHCELFIELSHKHQEMLEKEFEAEYKLASHEQLKSKDFRSQFGVEYMRRSKLDQERIQLQSESTLIQHQIAQIRIECYPYVSEMI